MSAMMTKGQIEAIRVTDQMARENPNFIYVAAVADCVGILLAEVEAQAAEIERLKADRDNWKALACFPGATSGAVMARGDSRILGRR